MDARRAKVIEELINHLSEMDGQELSSKIPGKPKAVEIEIESVGAKPDGMVSDKMGAKGPMDKLLEAKGGMSAQPKMATADDGETGEASDDDEMTDDELQEMLKHIS